MHDPIDTYMNTLVPMVVEQSSVASGHLIFIRAC